MRKNIPLGDPLFCRVLGLGLGLQLELGLGLGPSPLLRNHVLMTSTLFYNVFCLGKISISVFIHTKKGLQGCDFTVDPPRIYSNTPFSFV